MKKYIALALGLLGLGGCTQVNRAGELFLAPPLDVLEHLKALMFWLGDLITGAIGSFIASLF